MRCVIVCLAECIVSSVCPVLIDVSRGPSPSISCRWPLSSGCRVSIIAKHRSKVSKHSISFQCLSPTTLQTAFPTNQTNDFHPPSCIQIVPPCNLVVSLDENLRRFSSNKMARLCSLKASSSYTSCKLPAHLRPSVAHPFHPPPVHPNSARLTAALTWWSH